MRQITEAITNKSRMVSPLAFIQRIDLGKYFNLPNYEVIRTIATEVYGNDVEHTIQDEDEFYDNSRYTLLNVDPLVTTTKLYNDNYKLDKDEKYTIVLIDLKNTKGKSYMNTYLAISDSLVRKIKLGR